MTAAAATDPAPLLQAKQVIRLLNISRSTLTNLQNAGVVQPVRLLGSVVRYRRSDLDAILAGTMPAANTPQPRKPAAPPKQGARPRGRPRKYPQRPVDEV